MTASRLSKLKLAVWSQISANQGPGRQRITQPKPSNLCLSEEASSTRRDRHGLVQGRDETIKWQIHLEVIPLKVNTETNSEIKHEKKFCLLSSQGSVF